LVSIDFKEPILTRYKV